MASFRMFAVWCVFWAAYVFVVPAVMLSPQGVAVIYAGGGIAAGAAVLLGPRRSWIVLVPVAGSIAAVWARLDFPWSTVAIRTLADVAAVSLFAYVVWRHRRVRSGLGADVGWVAIAALGAAALRLAAVLGLAASAGDLVDPRLWDAVAEIGMSTMVGLVAGTAVVIGVSAWNRRILVGPAALGTWLALAGVGGALALVYFGALGVWWPALQFVIFPVLLLIAYLLPMPVTSLLTGASLIAISIAAGKGTGVFAEHAPADTGEILAAQTFMLSITISVFLLAASVTGRRSALMRAEDAAALMTATFRSAPSPAALVWWEHDAPTRIREVNPAFAALVGRRPEALVGVPLAHVLESASPDPAALAGVDEVRVTAADGTTHWLRPAWSERLLERHHAAAGDGTFAVLILEDLTSERTSQELLVQQARRDPLTGMPNRTALVEQLEASLGLVAGQGGVSLVLLAVDGLQDINDSLGYTAGDQIVVEVARRLVNSAGPSAVVARLSGDEFAIVDLGTSFAADPDALSAWIRSVVQDGVQLADRDLTVTMSGGIALAEPGMSRASDLIRRADIALVQAKARGRAQVALFEEAEERALVERIETEQRLRQAIGDRRLVCLFQPTADIRTGRIVGVEALVRLQGDGGTLIPPGAFLPLAAQIGLMPQITAFVLDEACRAAVEWEAQGHHMRVAFNVPPDWLSEETVAQIERAIEASGAPWDMLTVEVTEEATLSAGQSALNALARLRLRGIHVAIDDFGTGYAGLDSFRSLPADVVKIDMAFITDMLRTADDRELVRSMIELIHRFDKRCVAEGVESVEQFAVLGEMGCDIAQGYVIGRPMPFAEVPAGARVLQNREAPSVSERA